MHEALADIEGVKVFVDDILLFGQGDDIEEAIKDHDRKLLLLFERLEELNITLNPDKIQFKKTKLKYIGHTITDKEIEADDDKVQTIRNMPAPKNIKQLRSFLGMINYLSKFCRNLSDKSKELRELDKKDEKWNWTQKHQ